MSNPSTPARGRPARLDPAATVETALDLLDEAGLDALTMRRLADAMGVQAGALYRYFATKQDLLTAMAERILAEALAPEGSTDGDWDSRLPALARGMRAALLARRDGARVFAGTHSTGTHTLTFADTVIGVLRDAGFDDDAAARTLLTVTSFTVGHTLEEQAALGHHNGAPADANRLREAVADEGYPHLTATLPLLTGSDFAAHFEFGLRLLVQGLRDLRQQG
ncbi:TetR/AcrR family transcriptional regulator [Streptomyces sp. NBC_01142]|uniref:TetR/AcrR family transcriptional regulator n=1 Tax=Streptomyces sp. NBC_01142 TaxID=2975865 RepID=UPI00225A4798|nr:TetR/AcrR family transcriptional regulator [Streptomyces sp. NBC_01142]MCX4821419.1 TetR/AcrR family transcriptional regulator [Streptomyces sp. NBC_01142]